LNCRLITVIALNSSENFVHCHRNSNRGLRLADVSLWPSSPSPSHRPPAAVRLRLGRFDASVSKRRWISRSSSISSAHMIGPTSLSSLARNYGALKLRVRILYTGLHRHRNCYSFEELVAELGAASSRMSAAICGDGPSPDVAALIRATLASLPIHIGGVVHSTGEMVRERRHFFD
jgi:hypothetical protein